jgi:hypothetical protein
MSQEFDRIKEFFIKKIILVNIFKIDIPGYLITTSYSVEGVKLAMRTIMIPDRFLINLEDFVEKELGREGIERVYAAGKGDGYYVARITNFPRDEKIYSSLIPSFFGTLYANGITLRIEKREKNILAIELNVIEPAGAEKDRYSHWILGAWAGFFSYILGDEEIECTIKKVDVGKFVLINAKPDYLRINKISNFIKSPILGKLDILQYYKNNKVQTDIAENGATIKKLMNEHVLTYEAGKMILNKDQCRYIPFESFGLLQLENSLPDDIILKASYKYFFELGNIYKGLRDPYLFLSRLFTALGFGIVKVIKINNKKYEVIFGGYPWFSLELSDTKIPFVRGAWAGFLSGVLERNIEVLFLNGELINGTNNLSISVEG